ncbi:hypothetical protein KAREA_23310 [Prescottella equi]|nr:hypothetical protein RE0346_21700 [Prescottella equi]BDC72416.1 hypothetical protein KAREA_23310 [Prescottella equi]
MSGPGLVVRQARMVVAGIVVAEVRELSVRIQDPYFVAKAPAEPEHGIAGRCRGRHYQDAWFRASATRGERRGGTEEPVGPRPVPLRGPGRAVRMESPSPANGGCIR